MERTLIKDLRGSIGKEVKIQGWLQNSARPEKDAVHGYPRSYFGCPGGL